MIETMGLTHIQLAVRDVAKAVAFYREVFGMEIMPRGSGEDIVFLRTPGASDTLTLRLVKPRRISRLRRRRRSHWLPSQAAG